MLSNREVHQAILDTFDMWCDLDNPDPGLMKRHLECLVALQASRLRLTLEQEAENLCAAIKEQNG